MTSLWFASTMKTKSAEDCLQSYSSWDRSDGISKWRKQRWCKKVDLSVGGDAAVAGIAGTMKESGKDNDDDSNDEWTQAAIRTYLWLFLACSSGRKIKQISLHPWNNRDTAIWIHRHMITLRHETSITPQPTDAMPRGGPRQMPNGKALDFDQELCSICICLGPLHTSCTDTCIYTYAYTA
jgi:hypothetical protein